MAPVPSTRSIKLGPGRRYRYDYDRCTGCAVCFEQCPCHAIEMIPEPARMSVATGATTGAMRRDPTARARSR